MKKYISFSGCCVAVYLKSEYHGKHREFCEDTTFVGYSWNDKIASIRVQFKGYMNMDVFIFLFFFVPCGEGPKGSFMKTVVVIIIIKITVLQRLYNSNNYDTTEQQNNFSLRAADPEIHSR